MRHLTDWKWDQAKQLETCLSKLVEAYVADRFESIRNHGLPDAIEIERGVSDALVILCTRFNEKGFD